MKYINSWAITNKYDPNANPGDVVLIYNDNNGKRMKKIIPFGKDSWYFYIEKSDYSLRNLKEIYNLPDKIKIGKNWIRVYFPRLEFRGKDLINFISELEKRGIKTYEADLGPSKRYCLDNSIEIEDWEKIRILYFDIETDDSNGKIEIGKDRILSFAAIDKEGKEFFISDPDEKILLGKINDFIYQYDMLIGWNSKDFDLPYLEERFRLHKIPTSYLRNILHEDMFRRIQYFYSKDPEARQNISSYSLNSIAKYFLKESKIEYEGKLIDLYKNDFIKFKKYNIQDCKLIKKIEDKLGTIKLTYMMFQWCGCFCRDWSMVKTIDNFILSEANKKGIHYRTNLNQLLRSEERSEESEVFLGAYVFDPIPGYYENVYDLDFKSLYPNIIRTFNISPETSLVKGENHCITPKINTDKGEHGGMVYNLDHQGIISGKISQLLDQRNEIKKEMKNFEKNSEEWKNLNVKQLIVKELSNSIYGVLGNKWFRSFSIPLAESITTTGQYLIKYVKKINEKAGRKVIYGDTDSIFMVLKEGEDINVVLKWINEEIRDHLTKEFGIKNNTIELALDVKFDQFLIETKKKYVGKIGEKYKYVGMECVKRDSIPVAVNYQKKLIDKIMKKDSFESIEKWIQEKKSMVLKNEFRIEDITIRKKLSKNPTSYRGKSDRTYTAPLHVRIVLDLMKRRVLNDDKKSIASPGSIIQYLITEGGNGGKAKGVHVSEFSGKWDRIYYWNNIIFPVLEKVLIAIYPKEKWSKFYILKEKNDKRKKKGE